jgi:disulfide bond formation protein DsbB
MPCFPLVDVQTAQAFFATLAIIANLATIALVASRVVVHRSPLARSLLELIGPYGLWLAWLVALTCTVGSLYFSEVANFTPCTYCWYQRIAMYPLAVILGIAALRRDWGIRRYAVPVAGIGAAIALYHFLLERYPETLSIESACSAITPCSVPWFTEYGFVTLAYMALSGFALIIVLLTLPAHVREAPGSLIETVSQEA